MKECAYCETKFKPARPLQQVCSPLCASKKVRKDKAEQKARVRVERTIDRKRKAALVTFPRLEEECRKIVQAIARVRDRNDGCISCDLPANWNGQWHGSHYRSHGACSALQFNLWNIHKACWICNKLYSGRIDQYKPRLVEKVGRERVDWLDAQEGTRKHTPEYREYLMRFKKVMGKRLRRQSKISG